MKNASILLTVLLGLHGPLGSLANIFEDPKVASPSASTCPSFTSMSHVLAAALFPSQDDDNPASWMPGTSHLMDWSELPRIVKLDSGVGVPFELEITSKLYPLPDDIDPDGLERFVEGRIRSEEALGDVDVYAFLYSNLDESVTEVTVVPMNEPDLLALMAGKPPGDVDRSIEPVAGRIGGGRRNLQAGFLACLIACSKAALCISVPPVGAHAIHACLAAAAVCAVCAANFVTGDPHPIDCTTHICCVCPDIEGLDDIEFNMCGLYRMEEECPTHACKADWDRDGKCERRNCKWIGNGK